MGKEIYCHSEATVTGSPEPAQSRCPKSADKGMKQWVGVQGAREGESLEPERAAKVKGNPGENFITEVR